MRLRNLMLASCIAVLAPTVMLAAEADSKADTKPAAQSTAKAAEKPKAARCEPATGSYLCKSTSPMRVYTPEDLERTGVFDTNAALRKMDPTFR